VHRTVGLRNDATDDSVASPSTTNCQDVVSEVNVLPYKAADERLLNAILRFVDELPDAVVD